MLRRTIRGLLWTVKAALLAIAMGALWVWAWSWTRPRQVSASRFTAEPQRVECLGFHAGWGAGRIAFGRMRGSCGSGPWLEEGRALATSAGPGWHYDVWPGEPSWDGLEWPTDGRLLHWQSLGASHRGYSARFHNLSFPAWLPAAGAGCWPATSLALLIRRRCRMRRREQAGRCRQCGYDLRATPGRCPECGAVSSVSPD